MHVAAFFGHAAVMRILIRLGNSAVDIRDMSGFTPLHNAAERGYLTAVQHLLDAGASVDVQSFAFKFTPIFLVSAAEPTTTSHLDVLRELIDFGGDVTINGDGEVTPLHGAAKVFGTASIMKILIEEVSYAHGWLVARLSWLKIQATSTVDGQFIGHDLLLSRFEHQIGHEMLHDGSIKVASYNRPGNVEVGIQE